MLQAAAKTYTCRICRAVLPNRSLLHVHRVRAHANQIGGADLQDRPWVGDDDPFEEFPNSDDMEEMYNDNDIYILAPHQFISPLKYIYNFPINKRVDHNDVQNILESVYHHPRQGKAFKFTLSAGVIMENRENGDLRYFKPAINMTILPDPIFIKDRRTLQKAINDLQNLDIDEIIRNYRINTKWMVKFVTNVEVNTYNTLFPLGANNEKLPDFITSNRSIKTFCSHTSEEEKYKYCMFIALAQHYKPSERRHFKTEALRYAYRWKEVLERIKNEEVSDFYRVEFADLPDFEECFSINVNMYELLPDGTALSRYKSCANYDDVINLNIYGNHVNLICNIEKYASAYECVHCCALFPFPSYLMRHQRTCSKKTKLLFKGGAYKAPCTVFDKMEEIGINVPKNNRVFPYFVCFDFEAILAKETVNCTDKMKFTHRHVPVSCSIASNVPGHRRPKCIIDESPDTLVSKMFEVLDEIRCHALPLIHGKWGVYMDKLEAKINHRSDEIRAKVTTEQWENSQDHDGMLSSMYKQDPLHKQLSSVKEHFLKYINQLVIIGFNNSRYDEQLIKQPLIKFLLEQKQMESTHICYSCNVECNASQSCPLKKYYKLQNSDERYTRVEYRHREMGEANVIKRGNAYVSISNNFYHFIDVCQFLPPATSYEKFLAAYGIENGKQYFCYEWFDSFGKLNEQLPPYPSDAWYSNLRDKDILSDEHDQYVLNGRQGAEPLTGEQKYRKIQELWRENGWESMKDLLIHYNNADVAPFVEAVAIMMSEYFAQGIDVFKTAVSIPGISRYKMMQYASQTKTIFPLFPEKDKDLYFMFKSQLCAGASLIITRLAQKDVTPIKRNSEKKVKSCIGLDANALYCAQLGLEMPSTAYVRRRKENNFAPEFNKYYYSMQVWLKHLADRTGWNIKSTSTLGREIRVGEYLLDGYAVTDDNEQIAAEYYGCWTHQHINCELYTKCSNIDKYIETLKREAFLRQRGFRVITMWECDFKRMMVNNQSLSDEYNKYKPKFYKSHPHPVTQEQLLHAIASGRLYGYALVNIHVPEPLRDAFDSFPPIFCNHTVKEKDISPHMKKHMDEQGIKFSKGRRLLLTGMEAEEILLSTKMIEWCLKHGLRVSKILQVIEFIPSRPFKKFVEDVATRRLQGARDPKKKIIAEIYKLMG